MATTPKIITESGLEADPELAEVVNPHGPSADIVPAPLVTIADIVKDKETNVYKVGPQGRIFGSYQQLLNALQDEVANQLAQKK